MGIISAVLLFIMGLFLTFLVFPVAFYISAALGYLLGITALGIGVYMVLKRGGRILPAVLGVVVSVVAIIALAGTALVHMGVYVVGESFEEASKALRNMTTVRSVTGAVGESVRVDNWIIRAEWVKETSSILHDSILCKAKPGHKIVVVRLKVENAGSDVKHLAELWSYTLVTNSNTSYSNVHPLELEVVWNPSQKDKSKALKIKTGETDTLPPGTHAEYDVLFHIPSGEEPQRLVIQVGYVNTRVVMIELTR